MLLTDIELKAKKEKVLGRVERVANLEETSSFFVANLAIRAIKSVGSFAMDKIESYYDNKIDNLIVSELDLDR